MDDVIKTINNIVEHNKSHNTFQIRRESQLKYWIKEEVKNQVLAKFEQKINLDRDLAEKTRKAVDGELGIYEVSDSFLKSFLK